MGAVLCHLGFDVLMVITGNEPVLKIDKLPVN
jgi:hypothetical protein